MTLFIDTGLDFCRVAILDNTKICIEKSNMEKLQHSQHLHKLIDACFAEANLHINQIKHVAVLNGPGSYTGLRIGLACAKAICFAKNIPLILLNLLQSAHTTYSKNAEKPCIMLMHARKDEYYVYSEYDKNIIEGTLSSHTLKEYKEKGFRLFSLFQLIDNENEIEIFTLDLLMLAEIIWKKISNNNFNNLFTSEPYYQKDIYVLLPK